MTVLIGSNLRKFDHKVTEGKELKSMFYFSLTGKNTEVVMVDKTVHDKDRMRI